MTARLEVSEDKFEGEKVAMSRTRFICLLLFFFLPTLASAVEPCGFFEFPTLFGDTIIIRKGSNLTLPFKIRFSKPCRIESLVRLDIFVEKIGGHSRMPVCQLIISGRCLKHIPSQCDCGSEEFTYQFQTIVDQRDSGTWLWRTQTKMMQSRRLFFNVYIEDEPRVIDLSFHNVTSTNTVDKDTTVDFVCIWQSGNPPVQARLLDRHGKEMDVTGSYGLLHYTLSLVRCDDSGQYRCEAPNATENKTATLLVKCPPEITFSQNEATTLPGSTVELKFYVRSHTTDIRDCWLHVDDSRSLGCDVINVTGSPPDLVLSVYLANVNEADDGVWRLELRNDAGTGQAYFRLNVNPAHRLPEITLFRNEITAVSGVPVDFGAYVRSHTTNITDCWLKKLFPSTKPRLSLPCDVNRLMGPPPDLVLTLSMGKVEEADDGFWRLELTNDQGTGHADFSLKVKPAPNKGEESLSPSSVPITIPVVSSLAGAVAVVVVAVPVMFLCRRCRRRRAGAEVRRDMASNQSRNLYMEIQDEAVRTVEADDHAEDESAEPPDAEPQDAEPQDAEPPDAEHPDAQPPDAEPPDAEHPDAQPPDAQLPDAEPPDGEPPDGEQNMGEPFYWEIPDEPAPSAEGPPRPCLRRVPEGYLAPREPDAENEETESSQRLLPLYENSRIRHCSPRTLPGNSSRCAVTQVKAEVTVHADNPACSGTRKTASDDYLAPAPEREVLGAQGRNADEDLTLASLHSRTDTSLRSTAQGSASTDQSTKPLGHRGAPFTEEQDPLGSLLYLTPAPPRKHTEGKHGTSDDRTSGASSEAGLLGEQQRNSHEDLTSGSLDPSLHKPEDYLTTVPPRKNTEGQEPTSDAITIETSSEAGLLGEH